MAKKRRAFSPEYKADVVERIRTSGRSICAIVKEFKTAVRRWVSLVPLRSEHHPTLRQGRSQAEGSE